MTNVYRTAHWTVTNRPYSMRILWAYLAFAALCLAAVPAADANSERQASVTFNIPAQPVPKALAEFAKQAEIQLLVITDEFQQIPANAVLGTYALQKALDLLLAGTGIVGTVSSSSGIQLQASSGMDDGERPASGSLTAAENDHKSPVQNAERKVGASAATDEERHNDQGSRRLEEIVVTGSSIRGVIPQSTPLQIYASEDIRNTGALTVEGFMSTLPQNNSTLSEYAAGSASRESNSTLANAVDLRGLGVGSTLVLLNGRRIAPSSQGRSVDLSFIPLSAIERIEVLTDGASAVYGADAIGGVVNFVLKTSQDRAETVFSVGGAAGGNEQMRVNQSFGLNWEGGNAFMTLGYFQRNELDAADRTFSKVAAPFTLVPEDRRRNLLTSVTHAFPGGFDLGVDLLYSDRKPRSSQTQSQFGADDLVQRTVQADQAVLNVAVERHLGDKMTLGLLATHAAANADSSGFLNGPTVGQGPFYSGEETESQDITLKLDGELAQTKSGTWLFAVGAGRTDETFGRSRDYSQVDGAAPSSSQLSRNTEYGFAELHMPLVSPDRGSTGLKQLELNIAGRYTRYSDFGTEFSPKVGLVWSPVELLAFRGTWGKSFKAPFLFQLDPTGANYGFFPIALLGTPDIWSEDNSTIMMFALGAGNPDLGPEKAETYTLGIDLNFSNLRIAGTYFNIEYTDRVAEPDSTSGSASLVNPDEFGELFNAHPTADEIQAILSTSRNSFNLTGIDSSDHQAVIDATTVLADNRIRNLSISKLDGIDLHLDYSRPAFGGETSSGLRATKLLGFDEQIFATAPSVSRLDSVFYPADFKGRAYLGFSHERWRTQVGLSYVDEYRNPFSSQHPKIESWSTVDWMIEYRIDRDGSTPESLDLRLLVQNVLDSDPPFVPVGATSDLSLLVPTGFDPANANPVGRFIAAEVSVRW